MSKIRWQRSLAKIRRPSRRVRSWSAGPQVPVSSSWFPLGGGSRRGERFWPWKYLPRMQVGGRPEKARAQDRAQRAPRRPKTPQRRLKTAQDAPKTAQDAPKTASRGSKMPSRGLKVPSRGLKTPSRGPKRPPKGPKTPPGPPRDLQKH